MGIIEPNIDANLIAKYDVNGPRYTSYPTANHFSENLGVGTVVDTIKRIPVDQDLHFGGGTPTYLYDEQLGDVFDTIRQYFTLHDGPDCIQSVEETANIVSAAREQGINSVSVDVIDGPPLQTCESFARPLDQVNGLSPDRISLYSYAHLPNRFKTQKQINVVELPTVGLLPVTPKGRFFIRNVCMVFDAYLPVLTPAFSKAV